VKNGVHAVVYEKEKHLGGVLAYGIPEYRLPKNVVEEYIAFTKRMGVEYHTEAKVGLAELKKNYDKVFLGCGLANTRACISQAKKALAFIKPVIS
jgi:glutamate synthase (NADPH/NADH) small chain